MDLTVVVPVYRCGPCLDPLWARTTATLAAIAPNHEILFVDDASPDDSADVLARLAGRDRHVGILSLPSNVGQPAAIAAGVARSRGQWTAVMDGDLQDPPEVLAEFLALAHAGREVVVGRRRTHPQSAWRTGSSRLFSMLARARMRSRLVGTHGVFSLLSQRAVDRYLRHDERHIMYLPVLEALDLPITSVDYDRAERAAGTSSYDVNRLVDRAWRVLKTGPIDRPPRPS